ncbi:MAG TPA: M48 family metallopeptidase [Dehalococcoidia bacterium]|nr:M48 family metallopeptidase [Dehalococcoidia bacterium]
MLDSSVQPTTSKDEVSQAPDPDRQRRARELASRTRFLSFVDLGLTAAYLIFLLVSGLSDSVADAVESVLLLEVALYTLIVFGAFTILQLPLSYYRGYILPKRYGLLTQSFGAWLGDALKAGVIGAVMALVLLEGLYLVFDVAPDWWWLIAAGGYLLFTVVLGMLAPVILVPLFFKLTPLEDEVLLRRLEALAGDAGVRVKGVYVIDLSSKGTTSNAVLMGLGRTRRILLADTLLAGYTQEEIEVVIAHELAHHVHRDIPRGILVSTVSTLASFAAAYFVLDWGIDALDFDGLSDVAGLPLVALVLGAVGLVLRPLENAYSRSIESNADRYALEKTQMPSQFITMMTKLTDQNLSEADPGWLSKVWFYSHPPYSERVAMAERYLRLAESSRG